MGEGLQEGPGLTAAAAQPCVATRARPTIQRQCSSFPWQPSNHHNGHTGSWQDFVRMYVIIPLHKKAGHAAKADLARLRPAHSASHLMTCTYWPNHRAQKAPKAGRIKNKANDL